MGPKGSSSSPAGKSEALKGVRPISRAVRTARAGQRFGSSTGAVYVMGLDGALRREMQPGEPVGKAAVKRAKKARRNARLQQERRKRLIAAREAAA